MSELLTLHHYDGNLALDVPNTIADRFIDAYDVQKWINTLKGFGLEVSDNGDESTQFFFDLGRRMPNEKPDPCVVDLSVLEMAGSLIDRISWVTERREADPRLFYGLVAHRSGEATLGISLRWPEIDDIVLGKLAKDAMRQTVFKLGYPLQKGVRSSLRAAVSSDVGIELMVHGREGLGGVSAEIEDIAPDSGDIALSGEVMSVQQELICLAGALAIAHAEDLNN